ncbi:MAG: glycosyltransferase, partial [Alphaproteobacteria bacterium]|nr:glycosyltransferase [Alphaproteobacteria bacterium]
AVGGGVLVETGDVGALAEAMAMLMADKEARLMLGRQARSICAQYDLAGILARWDSVLNGTAADVRDGDPR